LPPPASAAPSPSPLWSKGGGFTAKVFWGGELVSFPLLQCSSRRWGMPCRSSVPSPAGVY
jgi:hypothetical protein